MKRIVLMGPNTKRRQAMAGLLQTLFPECEILYIGGGASLRTVDRGDDAAGPRGQDPDSRGESG